MLLAVYITILPDFAVAVENACVNLVEPFDQGTQGILRRGQLRFQRLNAILHAVLPMIRKNKVKHRSRFVIVHNLRTVSISATQYVEVSRKLSA